MRIVQKKVSQVLDFLSWWLNSDRQSSYLSRQKLLCLLQQSEERHESADEAITREIINLLDAIEGVARGDLTIRSEGEYNSLGVIAGSFNEVVESFASVIKSLPEENPTRTKYKI